MIMIRIGSKELYYILVKIMIRIGAAEFYYVSAMILIRTENSLC